MTMDANETVVRPRRTALRDGDPPRGFGIALIGLAVALVLNTVLGPLVAGVVEYPFSDTLRNQLIGLEIVTVAVVAPLSLAAGILALRGHRAAAVLAFGPAAYTAYMFVQYVLGPEYAEYSPVIVFRLALFACGALLAVWAWQLIDDDSLPAISRRRARVYGIVLLALAAFVISGISARSATPCAAARSLRNSPTRARSTGRSFCSTSASWFRQRLPPGSDCSAAHGGRERRYMPCSAGLHSFRLR